MGTHSIFRAIPSPPTNLSPHAGQALTQFHAPQTVLGLHTVNGIRTALRCTSHTAPRPREIISLSSLSSEQKFMLMSGQERHTNLRNLI